MIHALCLAAPIAAASFLQAQSQTAERSTFFGKIGPNRRRGQSVEVTFRSTVALQRSSLPPRAYALHTHPAAPSPRPPPLLVSLALSLTRYSRKARGVASLRGQSMPCKAQMGSQARLAWAVVAGVKSRMGRKLGGRRDGQRRSRARAATRGALAGICYAR